MLYEFYHGAVPFLTGLASAQKRSHIVVAIKMRGICRGGKMLSPTGLDFINQLLMAIAAGNAKQSLSQEPKKAWGALQSRVNDAKQALLDMELDPNRGRPTDDDEEELIEIGCWLWFHLCLDEADKPPAVCPPDDLVDECVRSTAKVTPRAREESRRRTLKRKFKKRYPEIMNKVSESQSLDVIEGLSKDLATIAEIFERRGIGFDLRAKKFEETITEAAVQRRRRQR